VFNPTLFISLADNFNEHKEVFTKGLVSLAFKKMHRCGKTINPLSSHKSKLVCCVCAQLF
jgi:hypothetical protein